MTPRTRKFNLVPMLLAVMCTSTKTSELAREPQRRHNFAKAQRSVLGEHRKCVQLAQTFARL